MLKPFSAALVIFAFAAYAGDPAAAILQAEKDWAQAALAADVATLDKLLSDDLTYCHATGAKDTKSTYLEKIRTGRPKYLELEFEKLEAKVSGDVAIANSTVRMRSVSAGTEQTVKLVLLHVYVKQQGQWRLLAHQSSKQ